MHDVEEHLGSFLDDDYTVFTVQGPLHSATETTEWTTPAHGRVERIDVPADLVIPLEELDEPERVGGGEQHLAANDPAIATVWTPMQRQAGVKYGGKGDKQHLGGRRAPLISH